jgi:hypothetical protein
MVSSLMVFIISENRNSSLNNANYETERRHYRQQQHVRERHCPGVMQKELPAATI